MAGMFTIPKWVVYGIVLTTSNPDKNHQVLPVLSDGRTSQHLYIQSLAGPSGFH
jgi:hypothetical protein